VPLSGDDVHVLAEEQAALRRVATLVARGAMPEEVFSAVTEEVGRLLSVEYGPGPLRARPYDDHRCRLGQERRRHSRWPPV
jgi:hypothetical protein